METNFEINNGWLSLSSHLNKKPAIELTHQPSPHCDNREHQDVSLLVIHNISLPPGEFGSNHISDLFLGQLNPNEHEYFQDIYQLRVSAHCLIRRNGSVIQYVPFTKRAWHAGVSCFAGKEKCNDFSIGFEMEGTDDLPYTDKQYQTLEWLTKTLLDHFPNLNTDTIAGHCDIAPGRKTDPGESFDWQRFKDGLS